MLELFLNILMESKQGLVEYTYSDSFLYLL